jgi:hypothetical protein
MTYAYGMKNSPVVGKGLGGLPKRAATGSTQADVGDVGDVMFTESELDEPEWMIADGTADDLTAADYPELLEAYGDHYGTYTDADVIEPGDLPASTGFGVAFSSDDTYMAVAHSTTPFITIYKRSGDTFTKLSNPGDLPANNGNGVAFSSNGTYMAVAHTTSPYITIYKRSGDTFTKLSNPGDLPAGTGRGVAFSSVGVNYLSVAHGSSPYITIYPRIDSAPLMIQIPNLSTVISDMETEYTPTTSRDAYMRVKP